MGRYSLARDAGTLEGGTVMLKITKLFKAFEYWNGKREHRKHDEALQEFAYRAINLSRAGKLYTENSKGEIVRVSDGKKVQP
jgi:hypothetical protein